MTKFAVFETSATKTIASVFLIGNWANLHRQDTSDKARTPASASVDGDSDLSPPFRYSLVKIAPPQSEHERPPLSTILLIVRSIGCSHA